MSLVLANGNDGTTPEIQVQSLGLAILTPVQQIGNIVARGNEIVTDHREWLAKFPQLEDIASTSQPSSSIITPLASLNHRAAFPAPISQLVPSQLCDCNPQVSAVSASFLAHFSGISSTARLSAQAAAQSVASVISVEQTISSAALVSEGIARSSVSAASISAAQSASSAIQSAMNSANSVVAVAQASASSAVASANSLAADAKATATFAVAQAQATISQVSVQASASVVASRIASMTETRFALALTFSIIGSSVVSILAYFLLLRYQKCRRTAKDKAEVLVRRSTTSSNRPSLSEFPHPRKSEWSFVRDGQTTKEQDPEAEVVLPDKQNRSLFSNMNTTRRPEERSQDLFADRGLHPVGEERGREWEGPRPSLERNLRKNTLIYDAERPDQPPKFSALLVESLRSVSQFGSRKSKNKKSIGDAGKRLSERRESKVILDDEGSEIGTAL